MAGEICRLSQLLLWESTMARFVADTPDWDAARSCCLAHKASQSTSRVRQPAAWCFFTFMTHPSFIGNIDVCLPACSQSKAHRGMTRPVQQKHLCLLLQLIQYGLWLLPQPIW